MTWARLRLAVIKGSSLAVALALAGCSNNPYPASDRSQKILYSTFSEAPKTLDPAVAYTTASHIITGNVYDTLLEYHFLKRPYELMPALAERVPEAVPHPGGGVSYLFKIRDGILFHSDPCFHLSQGEGRSRKVVAADVAFELARLADPAINSPLAGSFSQVLGFAQFAGKLAAMRQADAAFASLPAHEQYQRAGGIAGVIARTELELEIVLNEAKPQILYFFAMPFTTPVPWEAVAYYNGQQGREHFADHPVGTGPYRLTTYEKQYRMQLERHAAWYGGQAGSAQAPGAIFPRLIEREDILSSRIDAEYAGRGLPFLDRIQFVREREDIPRFNKFLQGYYDEGHIIKESFDAIVQNDALSPQMAARGMRLDKTVEPSIFYIGFNMDDPVVGAPAGERGRKLRQAMSLVIDSKAYLELFLNGRGALAQAPLPPGIFGYDADYKNPFRQPNLARAQKLLAEAGYRNGTDAPTGAPLKLSFDTPNTTAQALLQYQFYVAAWRQLGLDVEINATTYNQFQAKVRRGAYQLFTWGWIADFPDPENFFFLLECGNAQAKSGGPNTANFCNGEFDGLYHAMKSLPNDERRQSLIKRMLAITEQERPWIELFHNEEYALSHAWVINSKPMGLSYPTYKYMDVKPELRARLQAEWNAPVRWPLYVALLLIVAVSIPAVRTFYRERQ
jgi:peptide/nickel transport system substrate-binding protein